MAREIVIIGGGSAGAVLASRLSEDPSISVTLVESGRNYRSADTIEAISTPAMSPSLDAVALADYYWGDQKALRTSAQVADLYYRAKSVGGGSAVNGQVAFRPPLDDFDRWAEAGCTGWSGNGVLPYFIRMEDDLLFGDEPYHGRGGPIPVARGEREGWSSLELAFHDAAIDDGIKWNPDINSPYAGGLGYYPYNSRNGRRVSTNDGYLEPARGRSNLEIRPHRTVDRLLFDGTRVVGARVLGPDGPEEIRGDEFILAAGAMGSPSVLMRSGIGPSAVLRDLGVDVVADLPVGEGVQDHVGLGVGFPMNPAGAQGLYRPVLCALLSSELAGAGANDVVLSASGPFGPQDQIGSFMVFLYQCFSRGRLVLTSTDPDALPDVDMRQLSDERDRVRARFALSRAAELAASSAFDDVITATPVARDGTSFSEIVSMSASEFDEWIPKVGRDVAHMCSTCRMGSPDDAATVVDPDCRVLGVDGLRVIDASIFPSVTRSNTNFPTIMVAERMSDVIRGVALAAPIDLSTDVPA